MKRLLLVRENQTSQVGEFCVFLCMERWKRLGSLKSLLPYAPLSSLGPVFCGFSSGVSPGARQGVAAGSGLMVGIMFPCRVPPGLTAGTAGI